MDDPTPPHTHLSSDGITGCMVVELLALFPQRVVRIVAASFFYRTCGFCWGWGQSGFLSPSKTCFLGYLVVLIGALAQFQ